MRNKQIESGVVGEVFNGDGHELRLLELRESIPYKELIGKKIVDVEKSIGRLCKLVFDDGTYLDFMEDEGRVYNVFGGKWDSLANVKGMAAPG